MDAMAIKMDAQNKEMKEKSQAKCNICEAKFDKLADKQSARPFGSLPTQPNPRGSPSKPYQIHQARNEQVHAIFTMSGKAYDAPPNLNDSQPPIKLESDDEELTPQTPTPIKEIKETPVSKPYRPRIPYPQHLRKEKMEAQYGKFLDVIYAVRINVPLVDVLAGMPNYGKFLKELVSNKHKVEQISSAFLNDECSENILIEVGKFTFPVDFVILKMEEDSKVTLILGRPFLHIADAKIRVKQKQLNLGIGSERMIFSINSAMKHSYSNDDTCFSIDVIDEILEEDFDALLDEGNKILYSIEGTPLKDELFAEFDEFIAMNIDENIESKNEEELTFKKITFDTDYKIKKSLEEPPTNLELKPLLDHLEYAFLKRTYFLQDNPYVQDPQYFRDDSPEKEIKADPSVQDDVYAEVNPFDGYYQDFHGDNHDDTLLKKETKSEPIISDIGDEEEEYPFVDNYPNFLEEENDVSCPGVVLGVEE
ncbi:reverse transcriptase domain-containing protein [Tanacetum coccineum]